MGFFDLFSSGRPQREPFVLADANVPIDWRESGVWRKWSAPRSIIAGESHYMAALQKLTGPLREQGYLLPVCVLLHREPENPYDANAIRAEVELRHCGYIARGLAKAISPLLDSYGIKTFLVPGILRGGSFEAPNIGVQIWIDKRIAAGPEISMSSTADCSPWPPYDGEGEE